MGIKNYPPVLIATQQIMIIITPGELRYIADLVERKWEDNKDIIGANLTAFTLIGQGVNISFVVAQEKMKEGQL